MTLQRLSGIRDVAKLLDAPEDTVIELLEEGRLGGVLPDALRRRGVPVTPTVKNSVRDVVRAMEPQNSRLNSDDKPEVLDAGPTVTIMFTDIVNSTAIVDRLGDTRSRDVLRVHNQIVRGHTEVHGGTEVKSMGDGFMLTFPSARRGVACAVAVQCSLQEYSRLHPDSPLAGGAHRPIGRGAGAGGAGPVWKVRHAGRQDQCSGAGGPGVDISNRIRTRLEH